MQSQDGKASLEKLSSSGTVPALEARALTLAWGDAPPVACDINLAVGKGEMVCLVGRSGMGKTTLLHAFAGLSKPREGRVFLNGEDITGQPGHVSYMLQKDLLLPNLSVIDNTCLPLTIAGYPKSRAHERVKPLLERFGLQDAADKWPSQLSGGMRQRAAFLRTYLMGNEVIMLDEPFSALDAITRSDLRSWFFDEAKSLGLSTLMITHDPDEACIMADRVYVLGKPSVESAEDDPARILGEARPSRPIDMGLDEFALTPGFLEAKSKVLDMLKY